MEIIKIFEKFLNKKPNIPDEYELIYSYRKTLAIEIKQSGNVIIRAPHACSNLVIENFIKNKKYWIEKNLEKIRKNYKAKKEYSKQDIIKMKKNLKEYIIKRVNFWWNKMNLPPYRSIKITKSEKRWGSCSSNNWLCFSYRLFEFMDKNLDFIDAVIVHELCHLKEKNHGKNFWLLVYKYLPNYNKIISEK